MMMNKKDLAIEVIRASYRAGAKYVDENRRNPQAKEARIRYTVDPDDLDAEPDWPTARLDEIDSIGGALIT